MTTFEHALLGVNGALACGLATRLGWRGVALAGVAAVAPDWDGLPMLIDMASFEQGHRVWGHNIFACLLLGFFLGISQWRFDWLGWIARKLAGMIRLKELAGAAERPAPQAPSPWLLCVVASIAAMSQIPADAVVSGGQGLSDWAVQPFWPVSRYGLIYPMIPWGNVGVTVIFAVTMIAQAKWPQHLRLMSLFSLLATALLLVAWKWGGF